MLGYEPGEVRGHICMWREFCHPDDWEGAHAKLLAHMEGAAPDYAAEYRMRRKDGAWLWVVCRGKVIERDALGMPLRMIGYIQDITERKQAEDAKRASEQRLAADLDAMTRLQRIGSLYVREPGMHSVLGEIVEAAIAITGADMGNIQILEREPERLKIVAQRGFERPWLDYWDGASRGLGACGAALERGERVVVEDVTASPIFRGTPALEVQLRAGVRAVQSTPLMSRSGELLGVLSTHCRTPRRPDERRLRLLDLLTRQTADIIERAQGEAALAGSEERFRQLAENIRQVFWIATLSQDRLIYISPAYEEIWGRSRDSLYRNPRSRMDSVQPEDRPRVRAAAENMARGRPLDVEYRIIRPDGTMRWIRDRSYPMKAGDGFPLACGIAEDITELKAAEQEKLIHAIHQRDALVREIHHRIKNSLQGVVGLLRQKIRKYPAVARDMEEAIGQLQSVALVYGLQETRPDGLLSLAEITDAICTSAEKLIGGRVGRTFERVSREHACVAGAEAVSVAVALNELVFNALKHQPAQAGRKRATVTLSEAPGVAEIRISNRGHLPKSFDFSAGRAVGYGLDLVRTLLSPPGGTIIFNGGRDKVEVKVTLAPPLLAGRRKAHAR
jgi:PAS domain S-box-containing protein